MQISLNNHYSQPQNLKPKEIKLFGYLERLKFEAVRAAVGKSFIASNLSIRRINVK